MDISRHLSLGMISRPDHLPQLLAKEKYLDDRFFFVAPKEKASIEKKRALAEEKVEEVRNENERILAEWQEATQRWDKLYYCGRDDCVFLPGTNTYAPVSNMMEYIYE
jgi:hypothetical protein